MPEEVQTPADIAAARKEFLSEPPEIYDNNAPEPVDPAVQDAADEAAALEELTHAPVPETPEPATSVPPAPATADPYAAFGGEEQVRLAWQVQEALRTESGLRALVGQGLSALGYDVQQISEALNGEAPPAEEEDDLFAGAEDDEVLTVAQARELTRRAAEEAAQRAIEQTAPQVQSVQEAILAQQQAQVTAVIDQSLIALIGTPPEDPEGLKNFKTQVGEIVAKSGAYYDPNQSMNSAHVAQAVQRGYEDYKAEKEAQFKAYLVGKKQARDSQPVHISGSAGGEGPLPEPKNMAEARKQARAAGFFD